MTVIGPEAQDKTLPIEDHAVIGDLRTAALVTVDGTVSFLCAPRFDSPTIFATLLDPDAGHFRIAPLQDGIRVTQRYMPETNVLVTRFMSEDGIAELVDFMLVTQHQEGGADDHAAPQRLMRVVRVLRGRFDFELACRPRFDYARAAHTLALHGKTAVFRCEAAGAPVLALAADVDLQDEAGDVTARFTLVPEQSATFALCIDPETPEAPLDGDASRTAFNDTVAWWHHWIGRSRYQGRWREQVTRSALLLKLMTSARFGAMVAAPTFGLPERVGGAKNWDYRYCWVRDTSFAMYAFVRLDLTDEMRAFGRWVRDRLKQSSELGAEEPLKIMYRLDGSCDLAESELDHFAGWCGSRPVRIGNAAFDQFQLDIYGELLDAAYLASKYGPTPPYEGWMHIREIVEYVRANWQRPDRGIWESRGDDKPFLYSRLMCWVALDRAIRLAQKRSLPAPLPDWNETRLEIHAAIHGDYWDAELESFVEYPGAKSVDGSMLLMPLMRFIGPTDPRWQGTMRQIEAQLVTDALVFRRPQPKDGETGAAQAQDQVALDGLDTENREGSFLACSFWYAEALARGGDVAKARIVFDKLLGYANHVGLYAEELSYSGRHLGNFPQVLTHLALISAATYLDRALSGRPQEPWS